MKLKRRSGCDWPDMFASLVSAMAHHHGLDRLELLDSCGILISEVAFAVDDSVPKVLKIVESGITSRRAARDKWRKHQMSDPSKKKNKPAKNK